MDLRESSHALACILMPSPVCGHFRAAINSGNCTPWGFDATPKQMALKNDNKHYQANTNIGKGCYTQYQIVSKGLCWLQTLSNIATCLEYTMCFDAHVQPTSVTKQHRVAQCWPPHHTSDVPAMVGAGLRFKGGPGVLTILGMPISIGRF
jgi:hypothetical protein